MFRSVGVACVAVCLLMIGASARGDLINAPSTGLCNWTVFDGLAGGNFSGSDTLPIPGNQTKTVNSALGSTGGHIDTLLATAHTAASDRFDISTDAVSGMYGRVHSDVALTFTTTQWSAFTLQAQGRVYFTGIVQVVFNGSTHYRAPNSTGWPPFQGDIPEIPYWLTETGYLAPGAYSLYYENTQDCWRGAGNISGAGAISLALTAVDPSQIPLPMALWVGMVLGAVILRRSGR